MLRPPYNRGRHPDHRRHDLSISIQLCPEDAELDEPAGSPRRQPKLLVGWAAVEAGWEGDFGLDRKKDTDTTEPRGRRWYFRDAEPGAEWFFAVPLTGLHRKNDIEHHVVEPLVKLVGGASDDEAFPADTIAFEAY